MGRVEQPTEYHVRVDPRRLGQFRLGSVSDRLIEPDEAKRLELYREDCEKMVGQIKRHVDNVGSASVETETEVVCSFCGSGWTEGPDSPHNGGCCGEDCDVYEAAEAEAKKESLRCR